MYVTTIDSIFTKPCIILCGYYYTYHIVMLVRETKGEGGQNIQTELFNGNAELIAELS